MKLIIAGSRTIDATRSLLDAAIDHFEIYRIDEVVSGGARGVDMAGEGMGYPIRRFPADWDAHGKAAGMIRNAEMADYADALLLIWDGESRGSANMREQMIDRGKAVYEVILREVRP